MPGRNSTRRNMCAVLGRKSKPKFVPAVTSKGIANVPGAPASARVATVSQVKRMISKKAENKCVGLGYTDLHNQTITLAGDLLPLLPTVAQGTDQRDREGNKISPKGILVNLTLSIDNRFISVGETILPRVMVLSQKDNKDMGSLISTGGDQTHLLDYGTGEHTFTGVQADYRSPINTDQFIVHKDIKTKLSSGLQEQDSDIVKTFRFWVKCPSTLTYNDAQNYPRNFAPFMYIAYAKGDNTVDSSATTGLRVDYTSTLYFEDI